MQRSTTAVATARNLGDEIVGGPVSAGWADDPLPEVEELGISTLTLQQSNRSLGIVVALAAGIVSLGLLGHLADHPGDAVAAAPMESSSPSHGASAPVASAPAAPTAPLLILLSPLAGATIVGGVVEVHGTARQRLGLVHISVVLGNAVLGWTNVNVPGPGPLDAAIRVFAPPFAAPVELRVNQASGPRIELIRSFKLDANASVALWNAELRATKAGTALVVDGFGSMTSGPIQLTVRSGVRAIATSLVAIGSENLRPGSAGGQMIGLGSFQVRIPMPASVGSAPMSVDLTWQDDFGGGRVTTRLVEPL